MSAALHASSRSRMIWAGLLLLALGLGVFALGHGTVWGPPSPPHQFDRYYGLGPDAGSRALRQDLARDHPAGSDLGSLLARLDRAGFECRPAYRPTLVYGCEQRRALADSHTGHIAITIRANGVEVSGIEAGLTISAR